MFQPSRVAVAPDGTVYVVHRKDRNSRPNIVRRITPDGVISTFAGNGDKTAANMSTSYPEGVLPQEAKFRNISDIEVDKNGLLYIVDDRGFGSLFSRIYRTTKSGILEFVVGRDLNTPADGVPSDQVALGRIRHIAIDMENNIFIATDDGGPSSIRKINAKGIINRVLGKANTFEETSFGTALGYELNWSSGLAVAPDGTVVTLEQRGSREFGLGVSRFIFMLPPFPGFTDEDIGIASADGSMMYQFSKTGRHRRTINTLTGEDLYTFAYDNNGLIATITDFDGNVFTVERGFDGTPTALISPDFHRTSLTVDSEGYLSSITDPAGSSYQMTYQQGLLQQFMDPNFSASSMMYDELGRLVYDVNAEGGFWDLSRTEIGDGYEVRMTSALGRTETYRVENLPSRIRQRSVTAAKGTTEISQFLPNNSNIVQHANGVTTTSTNFANIRFGGQSFTPHVKIELPSGLTRREEINQNTNLFDISAPFSVRRQSLYRFVNDRLYRSDYDGPSRTFTDQSPESRRVVRKINGVGRPLELTVNGLETQFFNYDSRGRLVETFQGAGPDQRSMRYTYNSQGWLNSVTDILGRSTSYQYDAFGRVTRQILPDNREIDYRYDNKGNLLSITPPGRPAHVFNYNAVDQENLYEPPSVTGVSAPQTVYDYDLDKALTRITRPDGQVVNMSYEPSTGLLNQMTIPTGNFNYGYDPVSAQLSSIVAPGGESLSFTYDGFLPTSTTFSGDVAGVVEQSFDNDFRVISRNVNGTHTTTYDYDGDSLLIQAGELIIGRDGQKGGLITTASLGNIVTSHSYNGFAEMDSFDASFNSSSLISTNYTRDKLGRITQKVETIDGSTITTDYVYDLTGRLYSESADGVTTVYTYDANGNRTHIDGVPLATYDGQDRLLTYQSASYKYTENGELISKSEAGVATSYQYDVLGNLRRVTLPGDINIDYVIDGQNRRVGKKVNGQLVQGFLYLDQLNPVAELDQNNNVISRFVYGTKANVPDYMVKNGETYRIISDHLGSPRLVINQIDGTIVQRIDYDSWGNIALDSNPGFQPFGFAGGIHDHHTKLIRFGARDYDPAIGRWTSKDPLKFGSSEKLVGKTE